MKFDEIDSILKREVYKNVVHGIRQSLDMDNVETNDVLCQALSVILEDNSFNIINLRDSVLGVLMLDCVVEFTAIK